jgi:hypothetical protein
MLLLTFGLVIFGAAYFFQDRIFGDCGLAEALKAAHEEAETDKSYLTAQIHAETKRHEKASHEMEGKIESIKSELAQRTTERDSCRSDSRTKDKTLESKSESLKQAESTITKVTAEVYAKASEIAELESQLANPSKEARIAELSTELAAKASEVAELESQLAKGSNEAEVAELKATMAAERHTYRSQIDNLELDLQDAREALAGYMNDDALDASEVVQQKNNNPADINNTENKIGNNNDDNENNANEVSEAPSAPIQGASKRNRNGAVPKSQMQQKRRDKKANKQVADGKNEKREALKQEAQEAVPGKNDNVQQQTEEEAEVVGHEDM